MSPADPFTIDNLPYGVISSELNPRKRCATALGDHAIDLSVLFAEGVFDGVPGLDTNIFDHEYLNSFAALPRTVRQNFRVTLTDYLAKSTPEAPAYLPLSSVHNHFPMDTRNFSDFYCSLEHTKNCTAVFRADGQISSNWFDAPMAYNGRTSSLVVSATPVRRPCGIFPSLAGQKPAFQPEPCMDFELEMGIFLSQPLGRGERLDIHKAKDHIFGFVLLNDWSARSIQLFEMPPLGPFHAKGSATTISPWIVTLDAMEMASSPPHMPMESDTLPHLAWTDNAHATHDVELSVKILRQGTAYTICKSNLNELYWTPLQQLTHLASAGEGLSTGDIFGTGTISSARTNEQGEKIGLGCLFERKLPANRLSSAPCDLAETFLLDGDKVIIEGWVRDPVSKEDTIWFWKMRRRASSPNTAIESSAS